MWITESGIDTSTHSLHMVSGCTSKVSHAHEEGHAYRAWILRTMSSFEVENKLPPRDPASFFSVESPQNNGDRIPPRFARLDRRVKETLGNGLRVGRSCNCSMRITETRGCLAPRKHQRDDPIGSTQDGLLGDLSLDLNRDFCFHDVPSASLHRPRVSYIFPKPPRDV